MSVFPGKKGTAFTLRTTGKPEGMWQTNLPKTKKLNPSWNYSWGTQRIEAQPNSIEYVPMFWGGAKDAEAFQARIDQEIVPLIESGKIKCLLCFNEPDKKEQANMDVDKCLDFWPMLEKLDIPLVSPSCANPLGCEEAEDSCQGVHGSWMRHFMEEAEERKLRVDYIGVHWYGGANPKAFKSRMKEIYAAYGGRPLVLSEFAVADWKCMNKTCSDNRFYPYQVLQFMKEVLPWIEAQDWIAAYSWFPFMVTCSQGTCSALFDENDQLTACGRYYASITPDNPKGDQSITVK